MDTSITVNQVYTTVDANRMVALETNSGVQRLEYAFQKLAIGSPSTNLDSEGVRASFVSAVDVDLKT